MNRLALELILAGSIMDIGERSNQRRIAARVNESAAPTLHSITRSPLKTPRLHTAIYGERHCAETGEATSRANVGRSTCFMHGEQRSAAVY